MYIEYKKVSGGSTWLELIIGLREPTTCKRVGDVPLTFLKFDKYGEEALRIVKQQGV
jgi:hypothetical protein